ncbi:hypothetical protein HHL22_11110 [Hymenobacter sp. RP-2-7]|uniref:Carboxypeptidase-like regulatory domain-containing protein n=1 Tax=Hymenobacter polaris TaxID=2682546 RepID=A0A7Y0AEA9_9BACT|nr:carboxypeptidase-like regulatory domain-containing protein [Hymenobacter polaris]NML65755.1 hypothetical protein [Hymenobacter polaris]
MKLTATPFDPTTGELLPVYRDAYLRGDLARHSAQAVEAYLSRDADQAHGTVTRWHELHQAEEAITPNWVQKQVRFIREQPQRFRRRAFSLATLGALVAGASMASTMHPTTTLPLASATASMGSLESAAEAAEASTARTVLVHGRILNEKGRPLAGATVLRKGTAFGTSTDANGNYALRVPVDAAATLQYGYGGYTEQEIPASQIRGVVAVTLQPRAAAKRHWFFF